MLDKVMLEWPLAQCPWVRKRCKGGAVYLINVTSLYSLTSFSEIVWDACGWGTSTYEVLRRVARRFPQLEWNTIVSLVLQNIAFFKEKDLITALGRDQLGSTVRELIMQATCDTAWQSRWTDGVSRGRRRVLVNRFFQILAECDSSRGMKPPLKVLIRRVAESLRLRGYDRIMERIYTTYGLSKWRYDESANKICMVFENAVYEGDIDHRW